MKKLIHQAPLKDLQKLMQQYFNQKDLVCTTQHLEDGTKLLMVHLNQTTTVSFNLDNGELVSHLLKGIEGFRFTSAYQTYLLYKLLDELGYDNNPETYEDILKLYVLLTL